MFVFAKIIHKWKAYILKSGLFHLSYQNKTGGELPFFSAVDSINKFGSIEAFFGGFMLGR